MYGIFGIKTLERNKKYGLKTKPIKKFKTKEKAEMFIKDNNLINIKIIKWS